MRFMSLESDIMDKSESIILPMDDYKEQDGPPLDDALPDSD